MQAPPKQAHHLKKRGESAMSKSGRIRVVLYMWLKSKIDEMHRSVHTHTHI